MYRGIQLALLALAMSCAVPGRADVPEGGIFTFTESPQPQATRNPLVSPPVAGKGLDGEYEVDLLVLYTPNYARAYPSVQAAEDNIRNQVLRANTFYRNSGVPAHYRLVGVELYPATGTLGDTSFGNDPDVIVRRNALGADLVAMFENGTCSGTSTLFNHATPTAENAVPSDVDPENDAFALVNYTPSCEPASWMLAHELGHTMGGGHEIAFSGVQALYVPAVGGGYWKEYAHGSRCGNAGGGGAFKYVDIMGYGLPNQAVPTDVKGDFFSSPAVTRDGEACGADGTPGEEVTEMNNARSITEAAPYVAAYRSSASGKSASLPQGSGVGALDVGALIALMAMAFVGRRRGA